MKNEVKAKIVIMPIFLLYKRRFDIKRINLKTFNRKKRSCYPPKIILYNKKFVVSIGKSKKT